MNRLSALLAVLLTGPAFGACYVSGVTDQFTYFVAVDSTDLSTRETGLSSFTVYRSRDGAAAAAFTTPTVNETDSSNMPGVYELLLDEDMTIGAGNDFEEMALHITHAGMAAVTKTIELCRPKATAGETLSVSSGGATVATNNDKTGYSLTQTFPTNFADLAIAASTGRVTVGTSFDKTGYSLTQTFPTNFEDLAITDTTGRVNVGTSFDKTGYSLTQTFPTNFADLAITSTTGRVTVGTNNDKTGYSLTQSFPANFADLDIEPTTGHVDVGFWNGTEISTPLQTTSDIWTHGTRTLTAATNITTTGAATAPQSGDTYAALEMQRLVDTALLNCEVNTANFAGSTTTLACILTDRDDNPITSASNRLEGLELIVLSGAQAFEKRFIIDSTWDGGNSELQLTLSRALPGTLADAVTAVIR